MLCKYYWIVLYTVHVTAFCLGGPFFSGHGVYRTLIGNHRQAIDRQASYTTYNPTALT